MLTPMQINPNFIPLPKGQGVPRVVAADVAVAPGPDSAPIQDAPLVPPDIKGLPEDLFSKGEISTYYPAQKFGTLRDKNGRDISFSLDLCQVIGDESAKERLKPGLAVGYDVTRTASGSRISKLRIYS